MTPYQKRLTSDTQRLAEDLKIRNRAQTTIDAYTYHVQRFANFTKKPLDRATPEDVRSFQLYLIDTAKVSYSSFNQAVCALRFLYKTTIPRKWPVKLLPYGKREKKLPTVLSRQEVDRLFECTANLKHRTFLMALYGAGLRLSECSNLQIKDIDSDRMQLRIRQAKGNKERFVPLSPRLLLALREYYRSYRPATCLFPGKTPDTPYAATSIQKAIKASALRAKILKTVHPHVLRHSFATGLLEAGVDFMRISRVLGHSSFTTTMIYLHCRIEHTQHAPTPQDQLPVQQLLGVQWRSLDQS